MFPSLIAGGLSLLLSSVDHAAAENLASAAPQVSPPAAARVAIPHDAFPTPEMAEQFAAYLAWTKAEGLSRLAAFEQLEHGDVHLSPNLMPSAGLPTPEMAEQFEAYLRWTREERLGRFHAFMVSNFD